MRLPSKKLPSRIDRLKLQLCVGHRHCTPSLHPLARLSPQATFPGQRGHWTLLAIRPMVASHSRQSSSLTSTSLQRRLMTYVSRVMWSGAITLAAGIISWRALGRPPRAAIIKNNRMGPKKLWRLKAEKNVNHAAGYQHRTM